MRYLLFSFLLLLSTSNDAAADFRLFWSPNTASSTGQPLVVDLFIEETTGTIMNDYGISGASLRFQRTGVGNLQSAVGNDIAFDSTTTTGVDPSMSVFQTSVFGAGVGGGNVLRLATITISPTSVGNGTLTVVGANGAADDLATYNSVGGIDSLGPGIFVSAPAFNFSFSAVPEPTTFVLVGLSGLGAAGVRVWRRRVSRKKEQSSDTAAN